ncbi:MAG TPA: sulfur transferase domain-containing protein [Bryobacteraceae bacterium]|nr:sulfur transferase domain-containing protein [Bryobacteraceae bacterium]
MLYRSLPALLLSFTLSSARAASVDAPGVPNFHQVNDHLYRGGQPGDAGWSSLANLGVKLVVDLRPATEHPVQTEARAVEAAGMRYVNVPMKSLGAPAPDVVLRVLALLESGANGSVFVHCKRGSDRTGTMIACYRIQHDHWENQKALHEARSYGMYRIERAMMHYILNFDPASLPVAASLITSSTADLR